MIISPKNKVFLLFIGILLVANLVLLSFFIINKLGAKRNHADRSAMIASFLKKDIGFSQSQLQQYNLISAQHRNTVKPMFEQIKKEKALQFKKLTATNFSDSMIHVAADSISAKQRNIEILVTSYFGAIRNICTPQQQPKFDSLFYSLLNKRNEGNKK